MTPEDQAPQNSVNPAANPEPPRPKPWMPSNDENTEPSDAPAAAETTTDLASPEEAANGSPAVLPDAPLSQSAGSDASGFSGEDTNPAGGPAKPESFSPSASQGGVSAAQPPEPALPPATQVAPSAPLGESAPIPGADMNANASSPLSSSSAGKGKLVKLLLLIVVVIVVITGAYFGYKAVKGHNQNKAVNSAVNNATASSKASNAIDLGTLNNVKFVAPASALTGLTKAETTGNPNAAIYQTADGSCALSFGTATTAIDPGNSIADIVNDTLQQARSKGATVANAPVAVQARTFKDTNDSSKMYSMPTFQYSYNFNGDYATGIQSVAILKSGVRAVASVACSMQGSLPDASMLAPIEQAESQLTVTAE